MPAKPTRLDSRLFQGSDELVYLCLPDWFRNSLLSLTERMLWSRVWLDENWEDYQLTESDRTRIEYGIWRLTQDDCGMDCCEQIEEILKRLEELEHMNINVNCGGGCGCSGPSKADPVEGVELTDLCPPDDLPEDAPPQVAIGAKCDLSNYLIVQVRTTILNQWSHSQTWPEFNEWWLNLFVWMPPVYVVGQTYATYTAVSQWLANRAIEWITGNFDPLFNEMVCAIYQSTSPAHAQSSLFSVMEKLPYPLDQSAKAIAQRLPYSALFGDISSPPGFSKRECCGGTPEDAGLLPLPPPPEQYIWATLVNGEFETVPNNGSGQVTYDEFSSQFLHQPLTTATFHEVAVNVDISDVISRMAASSAHAIYVQYVNPPVEQVNVSDGVEYSSNTGGGTKQPSNQPRRVHFDNSEYANVAVFADFIDAMDATKTNYGNGAMDDVKASFRPETYGSSGAASLRFTVSYLLKL